MTAYAEVIKHVLPDIFSITVCKNKMKIITCFSLIDKWGNAYRHKLKSNQIT